jgi:HEAT repeat protein
MALGSIQSEERRDEVVDLLLSSIDDPSEKVCQSAIRSLGMLRADQARGEIEEFLEDENPYILGAAILALARLGAQDLAPRLAAFLNDTSAYVRTQSARAVGLLAYHPSGEKIVELLAQTRAARLEAGFSDPAAESGRREGDLYTLQNHLIRTAGELRLEAAVPLLLEIAQKDIGFRGLAVEALIAIGAALDPDLLVGLLADPSIYLRKRLMQLIAQYDYRLALPLIRPLLQDENVAVRVAALQTLSQMRDIEALPPIAWICFHDSNPFLRVQAVHALAELRGEQAIRDFAALASDANYQVRRAAAGYLVEWNANSTQAVAALAAFLVASPDADIADRVQDLLSAHGYAQEGLGSAHAAALIFPPITPSDAQRLITFLTTWKEYLVGLSDQVRPPNTAAALAALDFLLQIAQTSQDQTLDESQPPQEPE